MQLQHLFAALPFLVFAAFPACSSSDDGGDPGSTPDEDAGPRAEGGPGAESGGPDATVGAGSCEVKKPGAGAKSGRVFQGTLLLPEKAVDGELFVDAKGLIVCADKSCSSAPGYGDAAVIACSDAVISPGLINPHDHISFANNTPKGHGDERYEHRHDWRKGFRGHTKISTRGGASEKAILAAELRFVMSGATSGVTSGGADGLMRNLDDASQREGLSVQPAVFDTFPLGDSSDKNAQANLDMPPGECAYSGRISATGIAKAAGYEPHVAEGVDAPAHNEMFCQSNESGSDAAHDLMTRQTAVIHGIAVSPSEAAKMHAGRAMLIWSPRSNVDLYGNTASVVMYDHLGVPIALGTDWLPSGSMNMDREMKCADSLNQKYFAKHFTDKQIWQMVTANAAMAAGLGSAVGSLKPGYAADFVIYEKAGAANPYRSVIDSSPENVLLVMRGSRALYGEASLLAETAIDGKDCEDLDVCGRSKKACVKKDTRYSLDEVKTEGEKYAPLFSCRGEAPKGEPSCVPARGPTASAAAASVYSGITAGDKDGDGVPDAQDDCPDVFNPIRPMDGDKQADADADGIGDACDKCPLDAGESCTPLTGDDADDDGVANGDDDCPEDANPDQADGDKDGKGTTCDVAYDDSSCDDQANPGAALCERELAIETIRNPDAAGHPPQFRVHAKLTGVYVTAVKTAGAGGYGFYVQAPTAAPWQGMWIATPGTTPNVKVGNEVDVDGDYEEMYSLSQLSFPHWTITDNGTTLPFSPLDVDPATAKSKSTGEQYEGVLCRIAGPVSVTTQNADAPNDYDEFTIVSGTDLRVDDFLFDLLDNNYPIATSFPNVVGICGYSYSNRKIWPRSNADLQ